MDEKLKQFIHRKYGVFLSERTPKEIFSLPLSTICHPSILVKICETYLQLQEKSRGMAQPPGMPNGAARTIGLKFPDHLIMEKKD
jgi:hypothetical protein